MDKSLSTRSLFMSLLTVCALVITAALVCGTGFAQEEGIGDSRVLDNSVFLGNGVLSNRVLNDRGDDVMYVAEESGELSLEEEGGNLAKMPQLKETTKGSTNLDSARHHYQPRRHRYPLSCAAVILGIIVGRKLRKKAALSNMRRLIEQGEGKSDKR